MKIELEVIKYLKLLRSAFLSQHFLVAEKLSHDAFIVDGTALLLGGAACRGHKDEDKQQGDDGACAPVVKVFHQGVPPLVDGTDLHMCGKGRC